MLTLVCPPAVGTLWGQPWGHDLAAAGRAGAPAWKIGDVAAGMARTDIPADQRAGSTREWPQL